MSLLDTYKEQRFDGNRTFELFEDKVVVRGKTQLQSEFEHIIMLESLVPDFSKIRMRDHGFKAGIWMMAGAWIIASLNDTIAKMEFRTVALLWVFGFIGLLLSLCTIRKIEWVAFRSASGIPTLDIARAGKEKDKFDAFVEAIVKQIKLAKSSQAA